jgi:hypothetical protein
MNKIQTMVELLSYKNQLIKQSQEIQSKLNPIQENINSLNDQIFMSTGLYSFLCEKILETYTESELEEVGKYRKLLHPNPWIPTETAYVSSKIFDPFNDSWYIYDYEQEGDNIRFLVSCRKNEGSISGLMTFLDTHSTDWIKISELEMFEDEL